MKPASLISAFLLALAGLSTAAGAQHRGGMHPAYLHALSDLRHARANIDHRGARNERMLHDEEVAVHEIDEAIREIKAAAIDDGKNLEDHPPIDEHLDRRGRLHRAEELLHRTHEDLSREEDHADVRGLRDRALRHVAEAWHATQRAIEASR